MATTHIGLEAVSWFANEVGAYHVRDLKCLSSVDLAKLPDYTQPAKAEVPVPLPSTSEGQSTGDYRFNWQALSGLKIAGGAFWAAHQWANKPENSAKHAEEPDKQAQQASHSKQKRAGFLPTHTQKPRTTTSHPTQLSPQGPKAAVEPPKDKVKSPRRKL